MRSKVFVHIDLTEASLQLALVLDGRLEPATSASPLVLLDVDGREYKRESFFSLMKACCGASKQLQIRQLEIYRLRIGPISYQTTPPPAFANPLGSMFDYLQNLDPTHQYQLLSAAMDCCAWLADGSTASTICQVILKMSENIDLQDIPEYIQKDVFDVM